MKHAAGFVREKVYDQEGEATIAGDVLSEKSEMNFYGLFNLLNLFFL